MPCKCKKYSFHNILIRFDVLESSLPQILPSCLGFAKADVQMCANALLASVMLIRMGNDGLGTDQKQIQNRPEFARASLKGGQRKAMEGKQSGEDLLGIFCRGSAGTNWKCGSSSDENGRRWQREKSQTSDMSSGIKKLISVISFVCSCVCLFVCLSSWQFSVAFAESRLDFFLKTDFYNWNHVTSLGQVVLGERRKFRWKNNVWNKRMELH